MKHKTLLLISAALTVFTLIMVGGVVFTLHRANAAVATVETQDPTAAPVETQDPALAQLINDREAAYQDLIAQANARLLQAQQTQEELQAQINALESTPVPEATSTTVTPQQAADIAARYMGRSDLYAVENSTLNNQPAYLVTFSSGDKVFVSLDGQVLSVVPAPQLASQNIKASTGSHEHEHEHEGHESEGHDD